MATISKGINLHYGEKGEKNPPNLLTNLMEIPELGGESESIEITTLADEAHVYTNGIKNYGDSVTFKFLYDNTQFETLNNITGVEKQWAVYLPDLMTCYFTGTCSVKLDGVGVNAALTYTLSIKPTSAMTWEDNS